MKKPARGLSPLEAELYCRVHDGAPGDVAFYRWFTDGGRRALELGAGDGRVALELAAELPVVALERDQGMLERLRDRRDAAEPATRERLTIVEADMRAFALDGRFDRVLLSFTGIYCLLSEPDLDACLSCVRAHLEDDGRFAFDAYAADAFHHEARPEDYPDDRYEQVAELTHDGRALRVLERSRWDREAQRMDATYVYLTESDEVVAEIEIGHRYLLSPQVGPALARAGLKELARYGDFSRAAHGPQSGSMIVVAGPA